jgi:cytochrome b561
MRASESWRYGAMAVTLHWVVAGLLVVAMALGLYMTSIEDEPGAGWFFDLHKSMGQLIGLLIAARLVWRVRHRPQPLPASVPVWQARLSLGAQAGLYLLMVAVPLAGYLAASYTKSGVLFFGLATPHWAVPSPEQVERYAGIHATLAWSLAALAGLHVAAALKHLLWDKDGVFQRMSPRRRD